MGFVVLLLLTSLIGQARQELTGNNSVCPIPQFLRYHGECKCKSHLEGIIGCYDDHVGILRCFCMTVDGNPGVVSVGACPYTCVITQQDFNDTGLEYSLCGRPWNRQGRLCSQCIDGHGPPVYSYSMQCIPCSPEVVRDSIVYFLVSFLPLTVFCLVIITLRISGARPPMSTFILVSQVMASPQYMFIQIVPKGTTAFSSQSHLISRSAHDNCWKAFATFFGLGNLDIFRSVYPEMCLSPHMSTLQAKLLEYVIALFPLVVLLLVYFGIKLYDKGYWIVFCVLRPVISCLARLRQRVDIQTSLIDAFATFIILAINKIGCTSFIILQPVYVYSLSGNYNVSAYIDPTLTYFGRDHLPYALTALVLTFLLILIPLLLLFLYPLRSFQTFLNNRQWQCTTLHIFADSFQGCYKDGTNGTRDYRWFSGLHLLLRFIVILFFDLSNYYKVATLFITFTIALYMVLVATCQPYKKDLHMKTDMLLLLGLLLWCSALLVNALEYGPYRVIDLVMHLFLLTLATLIPLVYIFGILLHWVLGVKKIHMWILARCRYGFQAAGLTRLSEY